MHDRTRKTAPLGSTDWAAAQFLRMLDREERRKAQRGRLQPDASSRSGEEAPAVTQVAQALPIQPDDISYKTVPLQMRSRSMPVPDTVANPDDWYAFHDALRRAGMRTETEIAAARETFGHEGGMEVDPRAGGCDRKGNCDPGAAGLLESYMKDAQSRGLSRKLSTNPYRLTPEDAARWYKVYMDDVLHSVGGSGALGQIRDSKLAGEIADALFQHGRSKGALAVQEAANVVMATLPEDIRQRFGLTSIAVEDPTSPRVVGPATMARVQRLVALGLGDELRAAVARQRAIIYPPNDTRRGVQRRYDSYR